MSEDRMITVTMPAAAARDLLNDAGGYRALDAMKAALDEHDAAQNPLRGYTELHAWLCRHDSHGFCLDTLVLSPPDEPPDTPLDWVRAPWLDFKAKAGRR